MSYDFINASKARDYSKTYEKFKKDVGNILEEINSRIYNASLNGKYKAYYSVEVDDVYDTYSLYLTEKVVEKFESLGYKVIVDNNGIIITGHDAFMPEFKHTICF